MEKALTLDMEINHGAIYLMDIPVRYEFEKAFYEERQKGEVSVSRLKELMAETQRRIFGDVLEEGGEDLYFWASKLHFYITGITFYNFPYTFGYLLSRGLFSMFKERERSPPEIRGVPEALGLGHCRERCKEEHRQGPRIA
jgi:oligoendopeptidase F